jgi:parafibromin
MSDVVAAFHSTKGPLSLESISMNNITIGNEKFPIGTTCTFEAGGKSLSYSLLSIFLQVHDPSITLVQYRHLCKKYKVQDPVKATDKNIVLEHFLRTGTATGEEPLAEKKPPKVDKKTSTSKHEKTSTKPASSTKKKEKTPMTQQQIMDSLNIVVDKRAEKMGTPQNDNMDMVNDTTMNADIDISGDEPPKLLSQEDEERNAIQACLSAAGYEATKISQEDLELDRMSVEQITGFEVPVGNSASVLRCGATASNATGAKRKGSMISSSNTNGSRNFARVLELYTESLKSERPDKHSSKRARFEDQSQVPAKAKSTGKPIIIVPNAMTSPITLVNAQDFFQRSKFVPRELAIQNHTGPKPASVSVVRTVSSRLGGGTIEYEVIDNPLRKLQKPEDWGRVVAVIAQGAGWQFKGWKTPKGRDANPVDVFSNSFGYYIGFDGAPIPSELQGWNCKTGYLSRDKRGLDSVVHASFWNGLDEWMSVHKSEYLPGKN